MVLLVDSMPFTISILSLFMSVLSYLDMADPERAVSKFDFNAIFRS